MIITSFNPLGVGEMAKDYIVDYWFDDSDSFWRVWKSGFIEQGSVARLSGTTLKVNYFKKFSKSPKVICSLLGNESADGVTVGWLEGDSNKECFRAYNNKSNYAFYWYACGY